MTVEQQVVAQLAGLFLQHTGIGDLTQHMLDAAMAKARAVVAAARS